MISTEDAKVGRFVKTNVDFATVPAGTIGLICEDYGSGVMIAWKYDGYVPDMSTANLPLIHPDAPRERDGFDKETEFRYLDPV
jgi:hypothetical protein